MYILEKIIEVHDNCLFDIFWELFKKFYLCPEVCESFAVIFVIGRTQQPHILFLNLLIPIFIKIIGNIFMKIIQPMHIKLIKLVNQWFIP